jgi:hypothetical protein
MTDSIVILNKADTVKKINSIRKSTEVNRENIQAAVIGALTHAAEHGDTTLLTRLCEAVSNANATQLRKYIKGHAPVTWVKGKGFVKAKRGGAYDVAGAIEVDWNDYAPEGGAPTEKPFDASKEFAKLCDKLDSLYLAAVEAGDDDVAERILAMAHANAHV